MNDAHYIVGIDPGTKTGLAVYDTASKKIAHVATVKIHSALDAVYRWHVESGVFVRFEDARLRKWFGDTGRDRLQGAGYAKRDSRIWEDFLTDNSIPFEPVHPKDNMTKVNENVFKQITGYMGRTGEHGRDAACLLIKYLDFKTVKNDKGTN